MHYLTGGMHWLKQDGPAVQSILAYKLTLMGQTARMRRARLVTR